MGRRSKMTGIGIWFAAQTAKEGAGYFNVHHTTVSRTIRRQETDAT